MGQNQMWEAETCIAGKLLSFLSRSGLREEATAAQLDNLKAVELMGSWNVKPQVAALTQSPKARGAYLLQWTAQVRQG